MEDTETLTPAPVVGQQISGPGEGSTLQNDNVDNTDVNPNNGEGEGSDTPAPNLNTMGAALDAFSKLKQDAGNPYQTATKPVIAKTHPDARNYEGLSEEERRWFRDMKGTSYDKLYPFYLQAKNQIQELEKIRKENETLKSAQFYDQDGAWTLSPEYKDQTQYVDNLSQEANYWQEQLAVIESGQPWKPLMQSPDGQYILGDPQEATPQARALVMARLNQAQMLHYTNNQKLSEFGSSFKAKHQGVVSGWKETESKIFNGADQTKLTQAAQSKMSMFPPSMHGDYKVQTLAKALVVIEGLLAMVSTNRTNATTAQIKANISAAAGPNKGSITTGSGKNGDTVGDVMKQFNRAKQGSFAV